MKILATDLDGTFYLENELIRGVKASYEQLIKNNYKIIFTTNNSSKTPNTICQNISKLLSTEIDVSSVVTPLVVLNNYLSDKEFDIYVHGNKELINYVMSISNVTENIVNANLILVGRKEQSSQSEINNIIKQFSLGSNVMALNKDLTYPASDGKYVPGNGAVVKIIEKQTKKNIDSFGKPDLLYTEYLNSFESNISYMIGDRIDTDIILGKNIGAKTFLVKSSIENFMKDSIADFKFNSFSESVSFILKNF